jgi:hypothetical protein
MCKAPEFFLGHTACLFQTKLNWSSSTSVIFFITSYLFKVSIDVSSFVLPGAPAAMFGLTTGIKIMEPNNVWTEVMSQNKHFLPFKLFNSGTCNHSRKLTKTLVDARVQAPEGFLEGLER